MANCFFVCVIPYPTHWHPLSPQVLMQCKIHNMRERLTRLASAVEELAKHGKAKPDAERGLDEIAEKSGKAITKGEHYSADPLGVR